MQLFQELQRRNVVRVAIGYIVSSWLLAQVADLVLENIGAPDWVMQSIMLILALGFPVVLFFSWAYEVTPEGIKKESEIDRTQSITHVTGRKLDRAIVAVLVIALAYFAYDKFVLSPQREAKLVEGMQQVATEQAKIESEVTAESDKSIAVLPFVNMSSDEEQEYFSDGLSEELLNLLAKIPDLRVIARTSSFAYKGKDIQIADVARELKVAHVLEGSVRKAGNQVRITAQLIRASDSSHLWSETYDRSLDNIFAIQDEIAAAVVTQLKVTLLGAAPTVHATDPKAYALYLQGRHLRQQRTETSLEQAQTLIQQALAIEPDYAAAWAELGVAYVTQVGIGVRPSEEGMKLAREATNKALAIDPDYAPAHAGLGFIALGFENDLTAGAGHLERALQLEPANTVIIRRAASLSASLGRLDEALALSEYVVARDPVNPAGHNNQGTYYIYTGRWDEAIASFRTALTLSPGLVGARYGIGRALLIKGEAQAALAEFALEDDEEYRVKGQALALYALGRQDEYQAKLAELIERWGAQWPSEVAHVYAYTGDSNAAFEWLDKAIGQNEAGLIDQFQRVFYTPVHGDPRWAIYLQRMGSSPEQLDAIKFKVTLPE